MKRIIALMFSLLLLSSCGLNINMFREPVALANKTYNRLIHAIKRQDDNAIKKLFSKTVKGELVNFEEQTKDFISFIQGDFVSSSLDYYCVGLDGLSESGKAKRAINFTFQCETSEQKYCFAVKEYVIDEFDSNNVGISSLYAYPAQLSYLSRQRGNSILRRVKRYADDVDVPLAVRNAHTPDYVISIFV